MKSSREEIRKAVSVGTFRALMLREVVEQAANDAAGVLEKASAVLDGADPTWEETKALERLSVALVRSAGSLANVSRALTTDWLLDYVQGEVPASVRAVVKGTDIPLAGAGDCVAVPA